MTNTITIATLKAQLAKVESEVATLKSLIEAMEAQESTVEVEKVEEVVVEVKEEVKELPVAEVTVQSEPETTECPFDIVEESTGTCPTYNHHSPVVEKQPRKKSRKQLEAMCARVFKLKGGNKKAVYRAALAVEWKKDSRIEADCKAIMAQFEVVKPVQAKPEVKPEVKPVAQPQPVKVVKANPTRDEEELDSIFGCTVTLGNEVEEEEVVNVKRDFCLDDIL